MASSQPCNKVMMNSKLQDGNVEALVLSCNSCSCLGNDVVDQCIIVGRNDACRSKMCVVNKDLYQYE